MDVLINNFVGRIEEINPARASHVGKLLPPFRFPGLVPRVSDLASRR